MIYTQKPEEQTHLQMENSKGPTYKANFMLKHINIPESDFNFCHQGPQSSGGWEHLHKQCVCQSQIHVRHHYVISFTF